MIGGGDRRLVSFVADLEATAIDLVHHLAGLDGSDNDGFEYLVVSIGGHWDPRDGESLHCAAACAPSPCRPAQYLLAMYL
jgi:hypothetical protein